MNSEERMDEERELCVWVWGWPVCTSSRFFYGNAFADDIEWLLDQMCFVGFGRDWECGMEKWQSVEIGLFEQCEFAVFHCSSCRLQLANKVS